MTANKKAYQEAYQRALEGRSPRSVVQLLLSPFEDEYTRTSRLSGASDGAAARAAAADGGAVGETVT
jgi:hypothetical protein